MMDVRRTLAVADSELYQALRTRWFVGYALAFTLLIIAMSYVALSASAVEGIPVYSRTAAGMVNLVMLIAPLMGMAVGAQALAGDAERGALGYLLAQPLERRELYWGKWLGNALALLFVVAASFGVTGLLLAAAGAGVGLERYLVLAVMTALLLLISLSLGLAVSAFSSRLSTAIGVTVLLWFFLLFLGDLGLMGGALVFRLGVQPFFYATLLNPLQLFRVVALVSMGVNLEVLGPVGIYAHKLLGSHLSLVFSGLLAVWGLLPLAAGALRFMRNDYA